LEKFDLYVSAIVLRTNANNEESCTLTALGDTLPPKLISGKLGGPVWQDAAELAYGVGREVAP